MIVMPAQAVVRADLGCFRKLDWIPAFAGMTVGTRIIAACGYSACKSVCELWVVQAVDPQSED